MTILVVSMIVVLFISFGVLVTVLRKIFSDDVNKSTAHLTSQEAENEAKKEEIRKQLEDAKHQSQEIIANAQKDAAAQKDALLKSANEEKDKILAEALAKSDEMVKQADNARLALMSEIEVKIKEGAVVKARELLENVLPEDFRRQVHSHWVENAISNGFQELDRLRLPQGLSEVSVVSAFALSDQELGLLSSKLREKLGFDVVIKQQTDPTLISGLVVNVGSLILDASLKFSIQEAARV